MASGNSLLGEKGKGHQYQAYNETVVSGDLSVSRHKPLRQGCRMAVILQLKSTFPMTGTVLWQKKDMHRYPNTSILHIDTAKSDNGIGRFTFVWEMLLFLTNF